MKSTQRGSYLYESFQSQAKVQEFDRLYRQASILLTAERALWPTVGIVSGQQVLDLGCGPGVITRELAKQVYPAQVTGLDISQTLLDQGQRAYAEQRRDNDQNGYQNGLDLAVSEKVTFQQGNVYSLPFAAESFDVVYARLLFQHLSEPLDALQSIWHVLKPGGVLCILDVDDDWFSLYPEPAAFAQLRQAIVQRQRSQGGDPCIGRKLGHYLTQADFTQVNTAVVPVHSDQLGLANFFELLSLGSQYQEPSSGPEPALEGSEKTAKDAITPLRAQAQSNIRSLMNGTYAWAGFGLFVVTGRKPQN
ncbi:MAG: methyltransferase domain-containing protein [Phormidesmis sp.]